MGIPTPAFIAQSEATRKAGSPSATDAELKAIVKGSDEKAATIAVERLRVRKLMAS